MAERRSVLADRSFPSAGGFSLSEARYGAVVQVQAWPDTIEMVRSIITSELMAEAPELGAAAVKDSTVALANAPGRFLIAGPAEMLNRVATAFPGGDATVTDVSHGRVALKLAGDEAAATLQSCVMVDLDLSAFPAGRIAQTPIHHIDVLIHRRSETEFELWVLRSFAESLAEWLDDASVGVAPPPR